MHCNSSHQVYENYGNELCIVATNVSTMTVEYFHPKTTPDITVSLAAKCSSALPGRGLLCYFHIFQISNPPTVDPGWDLNSQCHHLWACRLIVCML